MILASMACTKIPWLSLTTPPAAPPDEWTARAFDPMTGWSDRALMNSKSRFLPVLMTP